MRYTVKSMKHSSEFDEIFVNDSKSRISEVSVNEAIEQLAGQNHLRKRVAEKP